MKRTSGFTLLELMIVVVIIGIGSMIAGTNMQLWVNKANAGGFFREAFMEASLAKSMALSTRRQHAIRIDFTANTLKIMQGEASHGSTSAGMVDVRDGTVTAPAGCRIDNVLTTAANGTVTATSTGPFDVVINPSGDLFPLDQVRIQMSGPDGHKSQIRIYGWTAKTRLEGGWS